MGKVVFITIILISVFSNIKLTSKIAIGILVALCWASNPYINKVVLNDVMTDPPTGDIEIYWPLLVGANVDSDGRFNLSESG